MLNPGPILGIEYIPKSDGEEYHGRISLSEATRYNSYTELHIEKHVSLKTTITEASS